MSIDNESIKTCSICGPVGHNEEDCPKNSGLIDREARKFFLPQEMEKTTDNLLAFFEAFYQNQGIFTDDRKQWVHFAKEMADTALKDPDSYFYIIKKEDKIVGTAQLDFVEVGGERRAVLSSLTVAEEERGKKYEGRKLSERLTDVRMNKIQKENCRYIDASIFSENPDKIRALAIKFKDGYKMYKFESYGKRNDREMGAFWLGKNLDGEEKLSSETSRVALNDLSKIDEQLRNGRLGVGIENETIIFRWKE